MFKDFSIVSSGGHLVFRSGMILAILVGNHLGNIPRQHLALVAILFIKADRF